MAENARLHALIQPLADAAGLELVRVRLMAGKRQTLQIMAERPDGTMTVADCAALSRAVSVKFDELDPIRGEYVLEVSSPGIDRPLTRPKDWALYQGHIAKVELHAADAAGRKRFTGAITEPDDTGVTLVTGEGQNAPRARLAYDVMASAKLVLTDKLIKQAEAQRTPPAPKDH